MKIQPLSTSLWIAAPPSKVWQGLTDPELVQQYLFGTRMETSLKPGEPIFFRGTWEGKVYEDKGTILAAVPLKRFAYTYWSSFSNLPDAPEYYKTITFELSPEGTGTQLKVAQQAGPGQNEPDESGSHWESVLTALKHLVEGT